MSALHCSDVVVSDSHSTSQPPLIPSEVEGRTPLDRASLDFARDERLWCFPKATASGLGRDPGFTLIEVVIALALFALIALAGVTLLNSVLRVQRGTQGRLERLADEQRAMFVIADDFGSMANAPLTATASGVEFARRTPAGPRALRYALADGGLQRALDHGAQVQQLLGGVTALRWQYYVRGKGWSERWPPSPEQAQAWPSAIAVDIDVTASGAGSSRTRASASSRDPSAASVGSLRRVVVLPLRPAPPPPRLVLPGQAGARQAGQPGAGQLSPQPADAAITVQ